MKALFFKITIIVAIFLLVLSCEKELAIDHEDEIVTSEYTKSADELLAMMSSDQSAFLTNVEKDEFRVGPDMLSSQTRVNYGSWQPVLGIFEMESYDGITTGSGRWFGHGIAGLTLNEIPDPDEGFTAGDFTLESNSEGKLLGNYNAKKIKQWSQHLMKQKINANFETGTQWFFAPNGRIIMNLFYDPMDNAPFTLLIYGWVNYGLADPPVPSDFEDKFPFEELEKHYIGLKTYPSSEAIYIETLNRFWTYLTPNFSAAAPGVGTGLWLAKGSTTMIVDQTFREDGISGRGRFYTTDNPDYQSHPYFEICHTMTITETGGLWPFDIAGGNNEFSGLKGEGTGVWFSLGEIPFGEVPAEGLIASDLVDDGETCAPYGITVCDNGPCLTGEGGPTKVYVIAYSYK